MFTGLVEELGRVERVVPGPVTDVWLGATFDDLTLGESVACDGVCLTVVERRAAEFRVQAAPETLSRSTLGAWRSGARVNLERALRLGDRLGGHWVQGHVDGVAQVLDVRPEGGSRVLTFALPAQLSPFFVDKGSVCIDGVSLTVVTAAAERFSVMLIPETLTHTTLGSKQVGDRVNLEVDIIGKYVARMMGSKAGLTQEQLAAAGFAPGLGGGASKI